MSENNTMIFTLTFNTDGGSGEFYDVTGEASSYYQLPSFTPGKPGYGFMGWRNSANEIFQPGGDYYFSYGDDTLTAVWEPIELTLTFNTNGSPDVMPSVTGFETESIYLGNVPIREGYYFSRWVNSSGVSFYHGDEYTFNYGNDTLTAKWSSTINFDLDGGEGTFSSLSYEEGINIMLPENIPERAGYKFVAWTNKNGKIFSPGAPYFFFGHDTLTAVWELIYYTLTFDTDGGSYLTSITQAYNGMHILTEVPQKEGFTFVKWTSLHGVDYYEGDTYTFLNGNDVLKAVWGYTVYIDPREGFCEFESVTKPVGDVLDIVPTREGYTFLKWINSSFNEFDTNNPYTFDYGNDNIWALWGYTVTYNLDEGECSFPKQNVLYEENAVIPSEIPTRNGYHFSWWEGSDGNIYYPGDTYSGNTNITFTAIWNCGVFFNADGGECEGQLYTGWAHTSCGIPNAYKEDYTLVKWVNESGVEFSPNGEYWFDYGDDTLTAVWGYTVAIDANGGEYNNTVIIQPEGSALMSVPEREGYRFVKWINKNNEEFTVENPYTFIHGDDNLTAVWECTLSYNTNSETNNIPSVTMSSTDSIILSEIPTKEGYTFAYWINKSRHIYNTGDTYTFDKGDDTLTAIWQCTVTLDMNGGNEEHSTITLFEHSEYTLDITPTKTGRVFTYWTDKNGNTYEKNDTYTFDKGDDTLTAHWKPKTYLVRYKPDIGKSDFLVETKTYNSNFYITDKIPEKEGYNFVCWQVREKNCFYKPGDKYEKNASVTLIAVWEDANKITILYDIGYGEGTFERQSINIGESITLPQHQPYKEGYDFLYWEAHPLTGISRRNSTMMRSNNNVYYSGTKYIDLDKSIVLKAIYGLKQYTISYNVNGGNGEFSSQNFFHNHHVNIHSETPIRDGYVFAGWYGQKSGFYFSPGENFPINSSESLIAEWIENSKEIPIEKIEINNPIKTLGIDESFKLKATVYPRNASTKIYSWYSDDTKAITVDQKTGEITAVGKGKANIKVKTICGKTYTIKVSVDMREKVIVKQVSDKYFDIEFSDGKVWKSIGCNIDENRSKVWMNESYKHHEGYLYEYEIRYIENREIDYNAKQLAFIYHLDPLGVEYYMKHDVKETRLNFKDKVYEKIFGHTPREKFCFVIEDGKAQYAYYPYRKREEYFTNAELLFGTHIIYDDESFWKDIAEFILIEIFGFFDFDDVDEHPVIARGAYLYQSFFHAGSFVGLGSHSAEVFAEKYIKEPLVDAVKPYVSKKLIGSINWVQRVFSVLRIFLDNFVAPIENDKVIYGKMKEITDYRIIFETKNGYKDEDISMEEIVALCDAD